MLDSVDICAEFARLSNALPEYFLKNTLMKKARVSDVPLDGCLTVRTNAFNYFWRGSLSMLIVPNRYQGKDKWVGPYVLQIVKTRRRFPLWIGPIAILMMANMALGQGNASAPPLQITVDIQKEERHARETVEGYYEALAKGDYAAAGSFMHADTIEPIRRSFLARLKKAPPAQKKATFRALGVADQTELEGMSPAKFFHVFARSQYGRTLQAMAHPDVNTVTKVKDVKCRPAGGSCQVSFELHITPKNEETIIKKYMVVVTRSGGRWLVNEMGGPSAAPKNNPKRPSRPMTEL
jgi:hypothetical protein